MVSMPHPCPVPHPIRPRLIGLMLDRFQVSDFDPDLKDTWAIIKAYVTLLTSISKIYPTVGLLSSTRYWDQILQGELGILYAMSGMLDDVLIKKPLNQHDKVNLSLSTTPAYSFSLSSPFPPSPFLFFFFLCGLLSKFGSVSFVS